MSLGGTAMRWFLSAVGEEDHPTSASMMGEDDAMFAFLTNNQPVLMLVGLLVLFVALGTTYYVIAFTSKAIKWTFRVAWKIAVGILMTIALLIFINTAIPWIAASMFGVPAPLEETSEDRMHKGAREPGDMIYILMDDGSLQALPRWSEIATRNRINKRKKAGWRFLDQALGFDHAAHAGGAGGGGLWGTIISMAGGWGRSDSDVGFVESVMSPEASRENAIWMGTKMVGSIVGSVFVNMGQRTVRAMGSVYSHAVGSADDGSSSSNPGVT